MVILMIQLTPKLFFPYEFIVLIRKWPKHLNSFKDGSLGSYNPVEAKLSSYNSGNGLNRDTDGSGI